MALDGVKNSLSSGSVSVLVSISQEQALSPSVTVGCPAAHDTQKLLCSAVGRDFATGGCSSFFSQRVTAALILPSISAGNSLATSAFSLSYLSYHPKSYPWTPCVAQHISLLQTSDSFQKYLEFPELSATKQLNLDLKGGRKKRKK